MRCPSCGAITLEYSIECSECGALQNNKSPNIFGEVHTNIVEEPASTNTGNQARPARSLIEFPGVRTSLPQWRKDLGERVREVQEKRAREAMLEAGLDVSEAESKAPLLELLPRTEAPPINPIVVAALQRIERAHVQSRFAGNAAVATMLAYDEHAEMGLDLGPSIGRGGDDGSLRAEPALTRTERVHNLAVVPRQVTTDAATPVSLSLDSPAEDAMAAGSPAVTTPEIETSEVFAHATENAPEPTKKPRRVIGDLNDPALNYLDSIAVTIVDIPERRSAPVFYRFLSAILDIAVVCLLSSPAVALIRMAELKWQDPRTIMFASGTFLVMGFLYLTISTAFTGRTLGMKPFSLRVVDARTGLIPTGGQSAARALLYLLSLASAGIALMYTFVNPERRAAHDRFTRTAVVRV